jgi:hypothetical protein
VTGVQRETERQEGINEGSNEITQIQKKTSEGKETRADEGT